VNTSALKICGASKNGGKAQFNLGFRYEKDESPITELPNEDC
jgi:hypothetical protein